MGAKLSSVFEGVTRNSKSARILMLGLDNAGKSTILYQMKFDSVVNTVPTIGFNVETVQPCKGVTFTVWDIGGQEKIRELWKFCYQDSDGFVYVVDSSDRSRFAEARSELCHILSHQELAGVPVVVIGNKTDLPNAASWQELVDALSLTELSSHDIHVQRACALTGDGIYEAMEVLAKRIKHKNKQQIKLNKVKTRNVKVKS